MSASTLALPPVPLSTLPERTKDFILALCNRDHCSPLEALQSTLDAAAARAGFTPLPPSGPASQSAEGDRDAALAA